MTDQNRRKICAVGMVSLALAVLDAILCIFSGLSHSSLHESRAIWQGVSAAVLFTAAVGLLVRARWP